MKANLFIRLGAPKSKNDQVPVRVCTGEAMTIRGELAVKNSTMPLAFNLHSTERSRKTFRQGVLNSRLFSLKFRLLIPLWSNKVALRVGKC